MKTATDDSHENKVLRLQRVPLDFVTGADFVEAAVADPANAVAGGGRCHGTREAGTAARSYPALATTSTGRIRPVSGGPTSLPAALSAVYTVVQPETSIVDQIELGCKGITADGGDQTVMNDGDSVH